MFEDATFESRGGTATRSRQWMLAAFAMNSALLAALVIYPLLHPEALPGHDLARWLEAPKFAEEPRPLPQPVRVMTTQQTTSFTSPINSVRPIIDISTHSPITGAGDGDPTEGIAIAEPGWGTTPSVFRSGTGTASVHVGSSGPVRISSTLAQGILISKVVPEYPIIAKTTHTQGDVVLSAVISKAGTIENLQVLSGSPMLRDAALRAVAQWRYKPYILNGEPVEVETTIRVVFTLGS